MSEPSLVDVQRWFKSQMQPAARVATVPSAPMLNAQRNTPGEEQLSIYTGGYLTRIHEALAEVYEAVHHVVGDAAFAQLAHAYAQRQPSHDYNLSVAGNAFPTFLTTDALTQRLPFLPDLAALEWHVCMAFHACEQPSVDPTHLASLSLEAWERTRLIFQPSVRVIGSDWPILDIWAARTQPRETIAIPLVHRPQRVLIFRQSFHVRCELLEDGQYVLLGELLSGSTLGVACQTLAARQEQGLPPVTTWFTQWLRAGLIIASQSVS